MTEGRGPGACVSTLEGGVRPPVGIYAMTQINAPAGVVLNLFGFRGKGQTDANVPTLGRYIRAGLPAIGRPSAGAKPLDRSCRTHTKRPDTAR